MRVSQSLLAAILIVAIAAPATADPSTTSRLSWVTNGSVSAAVQVGNTLYIGGRFTRVAPRSGVLGSLFGISATTGELTTGLPVVDGSVNAVEPDGAGGYYIGGSFTTIGGVARNRLAHLLADGTVDPAFVPLVDAGVVSSIRRGTASLFVGGSLLQVNGGPQGSFVALNPTTGTSVEWPVFTVAVKTLLVEGDVVIAVFDGNSADGVSAVHQVTGATVWSAVGTEINAAVVAGTRLILGGDFGGTAGPMPRVISLDVNTGVEDVTWRPDNPFYPGVPFARPGEVTALGVSGDILYVGGSFTDFGGQPRAHTAAVTISTGALAVWAPTVNTTVGSLVVSPGGSVFMGGSFTQVNGQPRADFAEVDAGGTLTEWVTNVGSQGARSLTLSGGTLVVGGHHGISGGGVRTNLAAFDLSTDTLLPWAPVGPDIILRLAATGDAIYIGSFFNALQPYRTVNVVSAVHPVTGATLPFTPPGESHRLLGAVGSHVYTSGDFSSFNNLNLGTGIRRLDSTGAVDLSWFVEGAAPLWMAMSENTLYFAETSTIWVADVTTGTFSQWSPALVPPTASITGLAVDGRTLYLSVRSGGTTSIAAFDRVSRLPVVGMPASTPPLQLLGNTVRAIAVADGQIVLGGSTVVASSPDGQAPLWNPALVSQFPQLSPGAVFLADTLLVTPTDVIALGYEADAPVPVYGIGVFSRTSSAAPTSLRGTTADNLVTLTWDAPSTPPNGYVLEVGAESGSLAPVSLPTGSLATSVTGVAGNGTYYIRVRAAGAPPGPANAPTNEIALVVGCSAPPTAPPLSLAAQVSGANVTITWTASPFTSASRYVLEAGSSSGASNLGTFTLPLSQTTIGAPVPNGTYFLRIRAENDCGESAASNEIFFTVGSATPLPPAPTGFSAASHVAGVTVSASWNPSAGALGYLLEVGSAPGLSDLATVPLVTNTFAFTGSAPRGLYYLRVRAGNNAGLSPPSAEVVLRVFEP